MRYLDSKPVALRAILLPSGYEPDEDVGLRQFMAAVDRSLNPAPLLIVMGRPF